MVDSAHQSQEIAPKESATAFKQMGMQISGSSYGYHIMPHSKQDRSSPQQSSHDSDIEEREVSFLSYPKVLEIEPKGNLTLVLGLEECSEPRSIIVSSHIVRRLSSIWDNLISKHAKKPDWKSPSKKLLRISSDNPEILVQIMRIVHSQFKEVVQKLTFRQLIDLALTSQRYATNHVLIPFLSKWTEPYRQKILSPGKEEWLFVAYQFGYENDFRILAKHLALNCSVDEEGKLIGTNGKHISGVAPPGAILYIQQARLGLLNRFLNKAYSLFDNSINANQCSAYVSIDPPINDIERSQCTAVAYHSYIRALAALSMWPPLDDARSLGDSVKEIAKRLMTLDVLVYHRSSSDMDSLHEGCSSGKRLAESIRGILDVMEDPVEEANIEQVKKNAMELDAGNKLHDLSD